jgi:hypothetical protein
MATIYSLFGFSTILKWVDNFLFIQSLATTHDPSQPPRFSLEAIYTVAGQLGWPWKLSKSMLFAITFVYLGFEWNISTSWVAIPLKKKEKYLQCLENWLTANTVLLNDTEKLVGSLIHCTLAIPTGHPHTVALIAFEASFPQMHHLRFL